MEKIYKPKEFSKLIGLSVSSLQRLDREKILVANRTSTNRRYYTMKQYEEYMCVNKKENYISKDTTLEEIEKIVGNILEGELKDIYVDDKLKKIVEKLFINYDVEIISI
mgnify:CR=1 FL=1